LFRIRRIYDATLPVNREALSRVQDILRSQFRLHPEKEIAKLPEQLRNPLKYRSGNRKQEVVTDAAGSLAHRLPVEMWHEGKAWKRHNFRKDISRLAIRVRSHEPIRVPSFMTPVI
jgi:hypothetical protein